MISSRFDRAAIGLRVTSLKVFQLIRSETWETILLLRSKRKLSVHEPRHSKEFSDCDIKKTDHLIRNDIQYRPHSLIHQPHLTLDQTIMLVLESI